MATSRSDLERQLALLAVKTSALTQERLDDADFFSAFAGESDCILDGAGPADYEWALKEVDNILVGVGRLRTDERPSDDLPPAR